jgi:hypothetical protein
MRRTRVVFFAMIVGAGGLVLSAAPAVHAAVVNTVVVKKVVVGTAPEGTTFEVNVTCTTGDVDTVDTNVHFDNQGNATDNSTVDVPSNADNDTTCTATESDTQGATATIECTKDPAESDVTVEDNTATFAADESGLTATCTVTNTFPEPTTTTTTLPPTTTTAPSVVTVQPTFTG